MVRTDPMTRLRYVVEANGCWVWQGPPTSVGYGQIKGADDTVWRAHRLVYTRSVGPVPEGMQLDHLCRNRLCVNPSHLEVVTPRENNRRGLSPSAEYARRSSCSQGHEFTADNIGRAPSRPGTRICLTCRRNRYRRGQAQRDSGRAS